MAGALGRGAAATALPWLLLACAHAGRPAPPLTAPAVAGLTAADFPAQHLYRVHYDGPRGGGSLRLTLRLAAADRYQIRTVDPLGRALWSVELDAGGLTFLDHRRHAACRDVAAVVVPELALAPLPLAELPAALLGRLPAPPPQRPGPAPAALDYEDARGRRWSAEIDDQGVAAWALWDEGEPFLFWTRQGRDGGILSHRSGSQFRWRRTATEPLRGELERLDIPAGYALEDCAAAAGRTGG